MQTKKESFTMHLPSSDVTLRGFQSPRGLREHEHRPKTVHVKIDQIYNAHELCRLIQYLNELVHALELVKIN